MQHYRFGILITIMFVAGWFGHQQLSPRNKSPLLPANGLQDNSLKNLIYQAHEQSLDEPIVVRRVNLIQDRPEQIMLELEYSYKGSTPANQVKLFVFMNSSYTYIGSTDVMKGTHIRRVSIGLNASEMKKDERYEFKTHDISISFEHYLPDKYVGVITRTMFPYEKRWYLVE
jgi:hypothetical protein